MKYLLEPGTNNFAELNLSATVEERNTSLLFRETKEMAEQIYFEVWKPITGVKITGHCTSVLHEEGVTTKYVKAEMELHSAFWEPNCLN